MKKILMMMALVALAAMGADPNPYADYGKAMASQTGNPMAVEWQNANDKAIAEATKPEALAAYVADEAAAQALCAKVAKGPYLADALDLTVVAAVSQYVVAPEEGCPFLRMLAFWKQSRCSARKIWTNAL